MTRRYAEFKIQVMGNTLVIAVIGPTGPTEFEWLRKEIENKYLKFLTKPWAILGDARQWELFTPDSKELIDEFTSWAEIQGMGFNLVLAPENSLKLAAAQEVQLGDVIEHHYAYAMEEAIEWLSAKNVWGNKKA